MNFGNPFLRIVLFVATFMFSFVAVISVRVATAVKTSEPIPVALIPEQKPVDLAPIKIMLQWGGFYAIKEDDGYKVFRLLDINAESFHVITYREKFRHVPNINEVSYLIPESEHEAYKSLDILSLKPIYFGRKSLSRNDLVAYANHLRNTGYGHQGLMTQIQRIIRFSHDAPLETKLSNEGGVLTFEQAGFN